MVERARVHPKAFDRPAPRVLNSAIHHPTSGTAADQLLDNAEKTQLAFTGFAKIQFQNSGIFVRIAQCVEFNILVV